MTVQEQSIDVLSTVITLGGIPVQWNRRYCVDRSGCAEQVATQLDEIRRDAVARKEQP